MFTSDALLARGHRALDWAAGLVDRDAGFRDAGPVINAYYKSVVAFTAGARLREARLIADHVQRAFWQNGDVNTRAQDPTAGGLANYRNAWLGRGFHALGRYDLSVPTGAFLAGQLHPESGGLAALPGKPEAEREYCWGSTGSAVLGLLAMGRIDDARRAGGFIADLLDEQPQEKGKIYLRRGADVAILREDRREGLALGYCIDIGTPGQIYWYLGMAMNAFANLYLATGETRWRDAGYRVFALFHNCADDVYEIISNGKVAWGLAAMHAATRDAQFADAAQDVWAWHCRIQSEDGRWLRVGQFDSFDAQPLHVTLDTTLERAFYMFELARTLDV